MTSAIIPGLRVGVWTSPGDHTGCTVILPPPDTLGVIAVRGQAPGTREAAALGLQGKLTVCHAVVLTGSSGYGLASADGVVRWLEQHGTGYPVGDAVVPIVGAAVILDGGIASPVGRVDAAAGTAACEAAVEGEIAEGRVGAGTGASVAKIGGLAHGWASGQAYAEVAAGGIRVGALVVNNALGEILAGDGTLLAASRAPAGSPRYPEASIDEVMAASGGRAARQGGGDVGEGPTGNTVIGCVITDAALTRTEALRVADLAHSGVARTVRPAHTAHDGDALFCLSRGDRRVAVDLVAALAADAVAAAVQRCVALASPSVMLPSLGAHA